MQTIIIISQPPPWPKPLPLLGLRRRAWLALFSNLEARLGHTRMGHALIGNARIVGDMTERGSQVRLTARVNHSAPGLMRAYIFRAEVSELALFCDAKPPSLALIALNRLTFGVIRCRDCVTYVRSVAKTAEIEIPDDIMTVQELANWCHFQKGVAHASYQ